MAPRAIQTAVLCYALALAAGTSSPTDVKDRTCTDDEGLSATELLEGHHIRIGLYVSGAENQCDDSDANAWTGNTSPCALYGNITQKDNKVYAQGDDNPFTGYKVWSGFDIDLLEELAKAGKFNYTIVSMGGGTAHPVAETDLNGGSCNSCKFKAFPWRAGRSISVQCVRLPRPHVHLQSRRRVGRSQLRLACLQCAPYVYTRAFTLPATRAPHLFPIPMDMLAHAFTGTCKGSDYTEKAKVLLGLVNRSTNPHPNFGGPVDLFGQGSWKYDKSRQKWAIWSSSVLSSDTLLLTTPPQYVRTKASRKLLSDPFELEVWWNLFWCAVGASILFWYTAFSHDKTKNEVAPIQVIYSTFTQPFRFNVR